MTRKSLLNASLGIVVVIAFLHFFALYFYLYWTLAWFDSILHFLGGIAVGFFSVWLAAEVQKKNPSRFSIEGVVCVLVGVFAVGVLWEFLELSFGLTFVSSLNYQADTLTDLVMDMLGGCFVLSYLAVTSTEK